MAFRACSPESRWGRQRKLECVLFSGWRRPQSVAGICRPDQWQGAALSREMGRTVSTEKFGRRSNIISDRSMKLIPFMPTRRLGDPCPLFFLNHKPVLRVSDVSSLGNINNILRDAFDQVDNLLQTPRHNDQVHAKRGTFRIFPYPVTKFLHQFSRAFSKRFHMVANLFRACTVKGRKSLQDFREG